MSLLSDVKNILFIGSISVELFIFGALFIGDIYSKIDSVLLRL